MLTKTTALHLWLFGITVLYYIPYYDFPGFHLDTEENSNLVPGFLGSLIGIRAGETRSFPIQFPESFERESLRGVRAQFTVSAISKTAQLKICVHAFH
jgi:hypothetical protein